MVLAMWMVFDKEDDSYCGFAMSFLELNDFGH